MVIDFHTHTFPDKNAERSIAYLEHEGNIKAFCDAKRGTLVNNMLNRGVDFSVVLPVATVPKQEHTINALSAEISGRDNVYYFGAIHPDCEDVEGTLDYIKSIGLRGIKLHPDYQGVYFDDERYIRIIVEAAKRDLLIVTHAGVDVAFTDDVHCTPDMIVSVLDRLGELIDDKLVLAHMGSYGMPDEVLKKLCGRRVFMDTAAVLDMYPEKCAEIIKKHGADRILFATDSPWKSQKAYIDLLDSLEISSEDKDKIFYKNAEKLLFN